jgi:hypothetical protein
MEILVNPNLPLQFVEGVLWAFVWAVVVLFCAELVCVVALWFLDGKRESASRPAQSIGKEAPSRDLGGQDLPARAAAE